MTKVAGPLHSLSAKGRFGDVALFSSWLGRPYVKVWSPSGKDSSRRQDAIHSILKRMNHEWMKLSREQRKAWQAFSAKSKPPVPAQSIFLSVPCGRGCGCGAFCPGYSAQGESDYETEP